MKKILFFGDSKHCFACKNLKPKVEKVCEELKFQDIEYIDIDTDEGAEMVSDYEEYVRSVPTLLLLIDGKVKERTIDNVDGAEIVKRWILG